MNCTYQKTELEMGTKVGRAVFRNDEFTAIVTSAHRGGCLYAGTIFLRNDKTGKHKTMSSTDPTGCYAKLGDFSRYLNSLAFKYVA